MLTGVDNFQNATAVHVLILRETNIMDRGFMYWSLLRHLKHVSSGLTVVLLLA